MIETAGQIGPTDRNLNTDLHFSLSDLQEAHTRPSGMWMEVKSRMRPREQTRWALS
jgi:hypothetical protein